jgi:uncharacterized SAM-binding protein YcdF (DUF218 family)
VPNVSTQNDTSGPRARGLPLRPHGAADVLHRSATAAKRVALGGLLTRCDRWGLSLAGKFLLLLLAGSLALFGLFTVYPFLAVTQRVDADVLVVEGWVHPYAIQAAASEFRTGSYKQIFSTGGPVVGKGGYINDYNTAASVGADRLKKIGVPDQLIQMVPSREGNRDRTYSSALALKQWLDEQGVSLHGINIVTQDVHARRTRLLFQKALGPNTAVGIIAVSSPDYDSRRWWRSSEAAQVVMAEVVGYVYARLVVTIGP